MKSLLARFSENKKIKLNIYNIKCRRKQNNGLIFLIERKCKFANIYSRNITETHALTETLLLSRDVLKRKIANCAISKILYSIKLKYDMILNFRIGNGKTFLLIFALLEKHLSKKQCRIFKAKESKIISFFFSKEYRYIVFKILNKFNYWLGFTEIVTSRKFPKTIKKIVKFYIFNSIEDLSARETLSKVLDLSKMIILDLISINNQKIFLIKNLLKSIYSANKKIQKLIFFNYFSESNVIKMDIKKYSIKKFPSISLIHDSKLHMFKNSYSKLGYLLKLIISETSNLSVVTNSERKLKIISLMIETFFSKANVDYSFFSKKILGKKILIVKKERLCQDFYKKLFLVNGLINDINLRIIFFDPIIFEIILSSFYFKSIVKNLYFFEFFYTCRQKKNFYRFIEQLI
jgi:hypothetical protein